MSSSRTADLLDLARLFLRLGITAFGGPPAHIAMMRDEVVQRRGWLSEQEFLDLLGATNLIPGPNSTEMAIHIGHRRAGWRGLLVSGICFILPAMLIVLALAWGYMRYGATPQVSAILYGIKPVVIALIVQALWNLGRQAVKSIWLALVGAGVLAGYFAGLNEIALLLGGGLLTLLVANAGRLRGTAAHGWQVALGLGAPSAVATVIASVPFSLPLLFVTFLKIGAVLYGSGYVLLAFLRADLVVRLGWLTDQQLLDAITIGQVTPGPVFTTATFIGYLLGGPSAAVLATLGIFLPSFVYVALSNPLIPRIRRSPLISGFLDGVNVASLGLMAAVTWQLGRASLIDLPTVLLALLAFAILLRTRLNSTWLIVAGALVGLLAAALR